MSTVIYTITILALSAAKYIYFYGGKLLKIPNPYNNLLSYSQLRVDYLEGVKLCGKVDYFADSIGSATRVIGGFVHRT